MWAEANDPTEDDADRVEPAEVDESLEARRLSRWLKAMFGGSRDEPEERDS